MDELKFEFEWEDPGAAKGTELRATWARLQVSVGSHIVTEVTDSNTRAYRSAVYLPLYPLAEWIAANWWFLFYEPQNPRRTPEHRYLKRHSFAAASEGYMLPSLVLDPIGPVMEVRWSSTEFEYSTARFVRDGVALLETQHVRDQVASLVLAVIDRLQSKGVSGTRLQDDWAAIQAADSDEIEFCIAAAMLGQDPYAVGSDLEEQIVKAAALIGPLSSQEFFAAVDIDDLQSQARWLSECADSLPTRPVGPALGEVFRVAGERIASARLPWDQGYVLAALVREKLGFNGKPTTGLDELADRLKLPSGALQIQEFGAHQKVVQSLAKVGENHTLGILIPEAREETQRFALARSFGDLLASVWTPIRLATRSQTFAQARNRAFAAELLAPASEIRNRFSEEVLDADDLSRLAHDFGVSEYVIQHQVENHRLALIDRGRAS